MRSLCRTSGRHKLGAGASWPLCRGLAEPGSGGDRRTRAATASPSPDSDNPRQFERERASARPPATAPAQVRRKLCDLVHRTQRISRVQSCSPLQLGGSDARCSDFHGAGRYGRRLGRVVHPHADGSHRATAAFPRRRAPDAPRLRCASRSAADQIAEIKKRLPRYAMMMPYFWTA